MLRVLARRVAVGFLVAASAPIRGEAQAWNDPRTRALVSAATERRARQLADTGLAAYTATAHGYLTFLAQVGEGFPDPPKVVKADELALEVYWRAPNQSKQWVVGRRDTLLLPTDIQYHRDHLGIVQNNFPNIVRLGDGDEVRDVPHPLSAAGASAYDFAITDSMRLRIPGREIDVYEVRVRPRDDRSAAAVGAVYISREDAQVVRMAFSFTRAALIDRALEDVSIVLENALIEGRFWLPRRQEIEIRRSGTWFEFPARGIIRGRWEICCYQINRAPPVEAMAGPEIVMAPAERQAAHQWSGTIMEALPADVRAATDEDVRRVQADARALVRAEALARSRRSSVLAPTVSDLVRVTRAEGLALGAGARRAIGASFDVAAALRFGLSDHALKGRLSLGRRDGAGGEVRLSAYRDYREAAAVPEASGLRNSIAAQEFGSDLSDPFDVRGVALAIERGIGVGGARLRAEVARESLDSVRVAGTPAGGRYEPVLPVPSSTSWRLSLRLADGARSLFGGSVRTSLDARLRWLRTGEGASARNAHADLFVEGRWPLGAGHFASRTYAGVAAGDRATLVQDAVLAGGPVTAPGYDFHQFATTALVSHQVEWLVRVPFFAMPLGRWGRLPGSALIGPTLGGVAARRNLDFRAGRSGWFPSVGLTLSPFFETLRIDVSRGLHGGRWQLGVDLAREFWKIL